MCLNPIPYVRCGTTIKILWRYHWSTHPEKFEEPIFIDGFIPCGKCIECQMNYSNEWALRCVQEMRYHQCACFVTLTYDDSQLKDMNVHKEHVQLFLKRLRKMLFGSSKGNLRYFACGEYGGKTLRPHYHLILFGYVPNDLIDLKITEKGSKIYTSETLFNIWNKGFVSVGLSSDLDTIKYMCKYLQKQLEVSKLGLTPAFTLMSTRPRLGLREEDVDLFDEFEYYHGRKRRPRAYTKKIPPFFREKRPVKPVSVSEIANKKNKLEKIKIKY